MDERYFRLLNERRNLIPVLSIDGGREITNELRGDEIYEIVTLNIDAFREKGLIFGASITATTENVEDVTSTEFLNSLIEKDCKLVHLRGVWPCNRRSWISGSGRKVCAYMEIAMDSLRSYYDEAILLSFPGDELAMGGCMVTGREFFHINFHGGAEPCPFLPYSNSNVKDTSRRDAITSSLFRQLQKQRILSGKNVGGCVLYEKRDQVAAIASGSDTGSADQFSIYVSS